MIEVVKLENQNQIAVVGNWIEWYDEETDTVLDTCPVVVDDAELLEIDEDRMVWETTQRTKVWEVDGIGNKTLVWEKDKEQGE